MTPASAGTRSSSFWSARRVLVTGGAGFLGGHLLDHLREAGASEILAPLKAEADLRDPQATRRLLERERPDLVIHLAARVGGIEANRRNPGLYFYENLVMDLHLIEESRRSGVEKFVQVGTVCSYPRDTEVPFREETLWDGFPEETNAPYGIAKKALLTQLQAYRDQYGFNGIYLLPANLYGPHDNFDLESSHVIPALVRKCVEARDAGDSEVHVWGTGQASREFLFVDDCVVAILRAAELYDGRDPVNLGTGAEVTIRALAEAIAIAVGFEGRLVFDPTRPDGQPRRSLATGRAESLFGFRATVGLEEGPRRTVSWYERTRGTDEERET